MKNILLISLIVLSGCVGSINERNAHSYANAAEAAQRNGDWDAARRYWAKATVNARQAGMPENSLSTAYYEYGRSVGVTCFFDEAETYLKKSLEIDRRINGPVHMSLLELARLNYDQNKHSEAVIYFEQLPSIYKNEMAEKIDPIGVAAVYTEYAHSLKMTNKIDQSTSFTKQANYLKQFTSSSSSTERTPYGKHCTNSNGKKS